MRTAMKLQRQIFGAALALLIIVPAMRAQEDVVVKAMKDELSRTMSQLQLKQMEKPYFISYRVDDYTSLNVGASLGSLTESNPDRRRVIGVEVRVGDYALDNSNYVSVGSFGGGGMNGGVAAGTLDDDYQEIRRQLWLSTDNQYKDAVESFSAKKAALQNRQHTEDVPDFSKEQPATFVGKRIDVNADRAALEQLVRDISLPLKSMPDVMASSVRIEFRNIYTHYLNSEGSSFTRSSPVLKLEIEASTQSSDGLPLHDSVTIFGFSAADLPAKSDLVAQARAMGERLEKMRQATSIDRYNGPVLFQDTAAAEIFSQAFAPGLIASRIPDSDDPGFQMYFKQILTQMGVGGSMVDKIGGRVMPDSVSIVDDPRLSDYKGTKLAGSYEIDDDSVPSRQTKLVENGMLKTLLAARTPVRTILHSTGSRRTLGAVPSNVLVTSDKTSTNEELKQELLRRVKQRGLEYGILVRRMGENGTNSFLRTAAMMASSPQSTPSSTMLEVYKVFPDGREEAVRGVELSGLTAATFRDIVAVGDKPVVYSEQFIPNFFSMFSMGMAGGFDLPVVSFVVPSMLFEEVTLTKASGPFPAPPASKAPLAGN